MGTQTLEGEAGGSSAAAAAQGGEAEEQVRIDFASIDARSREPGGKGEQEASTQRMRSKGQAWVG